MTKYLSNANEASSRMGGLQDVSPKPNVKRM